MLTPGAMMSGFSTYGDSTLGPLAEKDATTGAGFIPTCVPRNTIVALGFGFELMYWRNVRAADSEMARPGIRWESATSPSPIGATFATTTPAPPAFLTTSPFATRALPPRSHTTILPRTEFSSKEPAMQVEAEKLPARMPPKPQLAEALPPYIKGR
ncbi:hypothetical protein ABFX02_04G012300 [Erythranthe guttata]